MNEENKKNKNNSGSGEKAEDQLEEKLRACEKQRDEYLAGWQRAKADFINYKKEEMNRLQEFARYGNEDILKDFISVLDSFELAISYGEKRVPAPTRDDRDTLRSESRPEGVGIEKGVYMIKTQIEDILKKRGLERIAIKIGDQFDPSTAEAIKEMESEKPPGTILEEVEPGYRLYDKIVRPSRVIVSKSKN